jgi:hypothetical protein
MVKTLFDHQDRIFPLTLPSSCSVSRANQPGRHEQPDLGVQAKGGSQVRGNRRHMRRTHW